MSELNREQIVKSLECCAKLKPCKECPLYTYSHDDEGCKHKCIVDALALITSQEQRIKELTEEIERLKELGTTKEIEKELVRRATKFDTVRKMQDRLKAAMNDVARWTLHGDENEYFIIGKPFIDQIAKEMLEEG